MYCHSNKCLRPAQSRTNATNLTDACSHQRTFVKQEKGSRDLRVRVTRRRVSAVLHDWVGHVDCKKMRYRSTAVSGAFLHTVLNRFFFVMFSCVLSGFNVFTVLSVITVFHWSQRLCKRVFHAWRHVADVNAVLRRAARRISVRSIDSRPYWPPPALHFHSLENCDHSV